MCLRQGGTRGSEPGLGRRDDPSMANRHHIRSRRVTGKTQPRKRRQGKSNKHIERCRICDRTHAHGLEHSDSAGARQEKLDGSGHACSTRKGKSKALGLVRTSTGRKLSMQWPRSTAICTPKSGGRKRYFRAVELHTICSWIEHL
jgi:hypothetical protein